MHNFAHTQDTFVIRFIRYGGALQFGNAAKPDSSFSVFVFPPEWVQNSNDKHVIITLERLWVWVCALCRWRWSRCAKQAGHTSGTRRNLFRNGRVFTWYFAGAWAVKGSVCEFSSDRENKSYLVCDNFSLQAIGVLCVCVCVCVVCGTGSPCISLDYWVCWVSIGSWAWAFGVESLRKR